MNSLVEKVRSRLPDLEKRGAIYLFALFEREDAAGKWDVVLSSDWSDKDATVANKLVASEIIPILDSTERAALSRVVVIPSNAPPIHALTAALNVDGGISEVQDCNFLGLEIKHAFIFRSKRPVSKSHIAEPIAE